MDYIYLIRLHEDSNIWTDRYLGLRAWDGPEREPVLPEDPREGVVALRRMIENGKPVGVADQRPTTPVMADSIIASISPAHVSTIGAFPVPA